ncbi:DUF1631 domain-containing protein [Luteibacter aegosomatis]|uniref:DUF1631 family protein n=1 Tax=Luteibacter aegosomatis TaxID=2911537 RepID=UPI001FFBC064|nr:DUF1631 family protein [Luteibacter aegosomatis]UPG86266.1 DUF1631 domain-containing protein [Luteibacter aegosomatis]
MNPGTPPSQGRMGTHPVPLSPRAEREAQQGLSLCLTWLDAPLRHALRDLDGRLFAAAESSRNPLEQQACFDGRAIAEREGAGFRHRFAAFLTQRFRHFGESLPREPSDGGHAALSLVDPGEQERTDALASMAARAESRSAANLFELGYRMAVLAGSAPLEADVLPVGPRVLAAALEDAARPISLEPAHVLLLFKAVDAHVFAPVDTFYTALNDHYRTHGILPGFRVFPNVRLSHPVTPREPAASPDTRTTEGHIGVLEGLRALLAGRAGHVRGTGPAPRLASDQELQTALHALQGHVADVTDAARREIRSAHALREELVAQLERGRPRGSPPAELTAEQDDTVTLTAMLFESLAGELGAVGRGRSLLGGLQWPMLRAAMNDRGFFDEPSHPARALLETVGEAARTWLDPADGEPDAALLDHLERVVLEASQAQVVDPAWRAGIERQIAHLARKAHVAERRQIEAMDGRDKLERARRRAAELMNERLVGQPATRGVLRILLERTWADVLALHILRGGENGEAFLQCLGVTDQLLGRRPVGDMAKLRQDIERGLEHLGMHPVEASQVAAGVFDGPESDAAPTATDVALRLKQRPRLGEGTAHGEPRPTVEPTPLDPAARAIHAGFAQLRFGTWFEFRKADGGTARRKLAWFSPATGHCLFVTARGTRIEDIDLTRLAGLIAAGEAWEWKEQRLSMIDRAWRAVTRNLRRDRGTDDGGRQAGHG